MISIASLPPALAAASLSAVCPGLGQIHGGRPVRGAAFLLATLVEVPLIAATFSGPPSSARLVAVAVLVLAFVATSVASVIDAAWMARRRSARAAGVITGLAAPRHRRLWSAALVVVGLGSPLGSAWLLRTHVVAAFHVPTESMAPAIQAGDRVLAAMAPDAGRRIRPGDVVLFPWPGREDAVLVKRVVALGGQRVEVRADTVFVDGAALPRRAATGRAAQAAAQRLGARAQAEVLGDIAYAVLDIEGRIGPTFGESLVPEGTCFVLGDHRENAIDSRSFGFVDLDSIRGVVRYVIDPDALLTRFGPLHVEPVPSAGEH